MTTPEAMDPHAFVDVLEAEEVELQSLLQQLAESDWELSTPAAGWKVRDQVSHLTDTELIAVDTLVDGPRSLAKEVARLGGGVIGAGVESGRSLDAAELFEGWQRAAAATRATLRAADVSARVPWGLGMSWRGFVTARLMEHWAHGLDIRQAVHRYVPDTERLQHVAWIGYSSLPYAFRVAGDDVPEGRTLRLDLEGPAGVRWIYGPVDATDCISGPAGIWCRRAVQRIPVEDTTALELSGPFAELAVRHARAFL